MRLALLPVGQLRDAAAADAEIPAAGAWRGVTLAVDVATRAEVDDAFAAAVAAGAREVVAPVARDWGGCSGYVADPEGTRWELAWLPGLDPAG